MEDYKILKLKMPDYGDEDYGDEELTVELKALDSLEEEDSFYLFQRLMPTLSDKVLRKFLNSYSGKVTIFKSQREEISKLLQSIGETFSTDFNFYTIEPTVGSEEGGYLGVTRSFDSSISDFEYLINLLTKGDSYSIEDFLSKKIILAIPLDFRKLAKHYPELQKVIHKYDEKENEKKKKAEFRKQQKELKEKEKKIKEAEELLKAEGKL